MTTASCKDCPPGSKRPAPHQGPRCATHWREFRKLQKARDHARRLVDTYGISDEEYAALYKLQGGVCFICRRATGATRRLSVDHDHALAATMGPRASVRGLLCRPCNNMLGHVRDDVDVLGRAIVYLKVPPAQRVIV